jgi:hypothetical protein
MSIWIIDMRWNRVRTVMFSCTRCFAEFGRVMAGCQGQAHLAQFTDESKSPGYGAGRHIYDQAKFLK